MDFENAKVALVFDWMTTRGGAEKVNLQLYEMFPNAEIFCAVFDKEAFPELKNATIHTSFIQNLPFSKRKHQMYLSLMPQAYENFDLSQFDIVISSAHSCAKGVITKPETLHISYCHSPMRYAWDNWLSYINEYQGNFLFKKIGKHCMHKIRLWDRVAAERVDHYIANSSTTKARIKKYYNKESVVIHPGIDISKYQISSENSDYFLAVGRLIAYKKFDLIIETFNELGLPLKIVGTGNHENKLRKMANDNIEFLGFSSEQELKKLYQNSNALIFPQIEDFGIVPLEAMSCGKPVIAFADGGALDTVIDNESGIYFFKQSKAALKIAVNKYLENPAKFDSKKIRQHAKKFSKSEFRKNIEKFIREKWSERCQK